MAEHHSNKPWDLEVDVVAVGSGMGGTCAAIAAQARGQQAIVLEKADVLGGGTTYSYGIVWVGENHFEPGLGVEDTRDEAFAYLQHLGAGTPERRQPAHLRRQRAQRIAVLLRRSGRPLLRRPQLSRLLPRHGPRLPRSWPQPAGQALRSSLLRRESEAVARRPRRHPPCHLRGDRLVGREGQAAALMENDRDFLSPRGAGGPSPKAGTAN